MNRLMTACHFTQNLIACRRKIIRQFPAVPRLIQEIPDHPAKRRLKFNQSLCQPVVKREEIMQPRIQNFIIATFSFALILLSPLATPAQDKSSDTIKVETTLVSVPVIVSDRQGRYISGLKQADFTLTDDKVRQQIAFFAATEEPFNVALILDTSRSTQFVLNDIRHAAKEFIKHLRSQDRAMIVTVDYQVSVLSSLTTDHKTLEKAIENAPVGDRTGTLLRDGIDEVLEQDFKTLKGRKAIILLTDGKDHGSRISEDALLDKAEEADTLIYSIFYYTLGARRNSPPPRMRRGGWGGVRIGRRGQIRTPFPRFPRPDVEARRQERQRRRREQIEAKNGRAMDYLEELSDASAGRFYRSDLTDLKKTFSLIADELRHQYRLGFYPEDGKAPGSLHTIRVEVARADVAVRARKHYRTPDKP